MKRIVAGLTVVLLLAGILTGCGGKEEKTEGNSWQDQVNGAAQEQQPAQQAPVQQTPAPTQPDATQPAPQPVAPQPLQEVPVGTVLDAPEKVFDFSTDKLYIYFTSPDEAGGNATSMEIALDQITSDTYVLYTSDGLLKNHELVYECTDDGIVGYYKDAFMTAFEQNTESSQADLQNEHDVWMEMLAYFTMTHPDYNGFKYCKSDAQVASLTGEVLVYDIMEGDQVGGQLCIDKATGLMVSLKLDGTVIYSVQQIKTSDLGIPAYK